jgi:hypothetical protein
MGLPSVASAYREVLWSGLHETEGQPEGYGAVRRQLHAGTSSPSQMGLVSVTLI